jgi:lipoic acid synthetase
VTPDSAEVDIIRLARQALREAPELARPPWVKVPRLSGAAREMMDRPLTGLHTVCHSANCPNIGECWGRGTATFMVMGDKCTRACRFCNVDFGAPEPLNPHEPALLAQSIAELGLKYSVITCVDRDDLADSGAAHWAACIGAIRARTPEVGVEILTGDFKGRCEDIATVVHARPEVFAHNVETIPRLQPIVRHKARWETSIRVLTTVQELARQHGYTILTKTGMMLGLGETNDEVQAAMRLIRDEGVDLLTLGQYLKPKQRDDKLPMLRFVTPEDFEELRQYGYAIGFKGVAASPLTRSSHLAETLFAAAMGWEQPVASYRIHQ